MLAIRQLVRQYQDELLRTAYLLTGDREDAIRLASATFLEYFQALSVSSPERDVRSWLLELLGETFVSGQTADISALEFPSEVCSPATTSHLQHFNVDDEPARVKAILLRLDRQTRTALVLIGFNGLDANVVAQITGQTLENQRSALERAKDRVAEATGRPDRKLRIPLSAVAIAAPQLDLWQYLEEPLGRIETRHQHRNRLLTGGVAGAAGLVLLFGLVWLFAADAFDEQQTTPPVSDPVLTATVANVAGLQPTAVPDEPEVEPASVPASRSAAGEIPDLQMVTNTRFFDFENVYSSVTSLRVTGPPASQPIYIENAERPFGISPDGSWALFIGTTWNGDYPQGLTKLTAYQTEDGEIGWQQFYEDTAPVAVALTLEQAYVASYDGQLHSYSLWTGTKTGSWQLAGPAAEDVGVGNDENSPAEHLIQLFVAPNQRRLYAYFATDGSQTEPPTRTLRSYLLPGMTLVSSQSKAMEPSSDNWWIFDFSIWDAWPTADGSSLYALMLTETDDFAIRFLDLDSNAIDEVVLPFYSDDGRLIPHIVPSNSGRWLYAISGDGQRVALIDLLERRLERVSPIDDSMVGRGVESVNYYDQQRQTGPWMSALTLDGERLYLAMSSAYDDPAASTTILTIDVRTWKIVDRWKFDGRVRQLVASADGERLEMYLEYPNSFIEPGVLESRVVMVDREGTVTSERPVATYLPIAEPIGIVKLLSLLDTYQRQFGHAPAVGGRKPADAELRSTLPELEITAASPTIASGTQVDIAVRFLDPVSGETLAETRPDVRGDADTALTITLTNGDAEPVILQPSRMDDSVYRALATLETPGSWAATVTVNDGNGVVWNVRTTRLVEVIRSFVADDGKRYYPLFFTIPDEPVTGELFTVGVEFRSIDNDLPIAEDVDLPPGLPEEIRVSFIARDLSYASKTLVQVGHGRYEGERGFRDPARRTLIFDFRLGDQQITMGGGSFAVHSPPGD